MSTPVLSPSSAHSVVRRIYLLLGLVVAGMVIAYFAVPASVVERNREEKRFAAQQDDLAAALYQLDQLVLATHLDTRRGPPAANLGTPVDLIAELAINHGPAIQVAQNAILRLERAKVFPGAPPIVTRLNRQIEAFLARPDSVLALKQVLLSSEQLRRLSVRAGELRSETSAQFSPEDQPWVAGLLFTLLAGIGWVAALLIQSSRRTVQALVETIAERDIQAVALRSERDFSARLVDTAPAIILVLDPAGAIQQVNPFFEQLTGWRLDELRGRDWFATCLPERDRDRIRTFYQVATEDVRIRDYTNPILTRSGEEREVEWTNQALHDDAGRLTGLLAVGLDVTERQQAHEALRAREAQTRQILDGLFGFVGVCTVDGTLIDANEAPLRAAGVRREDVLGRPFWTTYWWSYDPGVQAELQAALAQAARGEIARYEPVVRIQGGALITIDVTFGPLRNAAGEITHILGFAIDISSRKKGEETLRVSEERLRLALRAAGQGTYDLDLTTGDAAVSAEYVEMIGHDPATFRETHAAWRERLHPDDRAKVYGTFEAYMRGEIPHYEVEFRQHTKSGGWLWTRSVGGIAERDTSGRPRRMLGTHTNIDAARRTAQTLIDKEAQLSAIVAGTFDGILMTDVETRRFTFANAAMSRLLGATPEEVLAMDLGNVFPAEKLPAIIGDVGSLPAGDRDHFFDSPLRQKDGRTLIVEISGSRVELGGRLHHIAVFRDITERRAAEAALQASEARYRRAERGSNDGLWEWKIATGEDYLSPRWLGMLGYLPGELPYRIDTFFDLLHPDDKAPVAEAVDRHFHRGEPFDQEIRLRHKNGEYLWVRTRAETERDADGKPLLMTGTISDISEQKTKAEALAASEARFRAILDASPVPMALNDVARRITYLNPAFTQVFGYTHEEIPTLADWWPIAYPDPAYRQSVSDNWQKELVRANQTATSFEPLEVKIRCKDGTDRIVMASAAPLTSRFADTNVVVLHDITAFRQAENTVTESLARLNQAQRVAKVGSWDLDLTSLKLHWSSEIFRLFELDPAKFEANYDAFLSVVHPEDRAAVNVAYTDSLRDQRPYRIVHRIQMADGRIKYVEEQCETDFSAEGKALRSRGTVQDVTERVVAEEAVRRSLREKEMLLREIHHRVKNNLQIISSLLYFQTRKVHDSQALDVFGEVRERLRAMMLVHEKLYHSRDLAEVDFGDYVRSLVHQLAPSSAGAGPSLHFKVDVVPLGLCIEQALPCGMILVELLTNVIKYAFPDGRRGEALVQLTLANGRISLTVSDDGVGLPPDFDAETPASFGWQLIRNLTTQLEGLTTVEQAAGTRVTVSFPHRVAPPHP